MADVYALAKTLWVLATGQEILLDRPDQPGSTPEGFSISDDRYDPRNGALDKLIDRVTCIHRVQRPTMEEMADELFVLEHDQHRATRCRRAGCPAATAIKA